MESDLNRIQGCLFGLAFGDAFGAPTEFLSVREIVNRWPPDGPSQLFGNPIRVTDDTQMTIAVADAFLEVKDWKKARSGWKQLIYIANGLASVI
jgi:ADP-ribosylglycohydrolase